MEIVITQCQVAVGEIPGIPGAKSLEFLTPSGIKVRVLLNAEVAQIIADQLRSNRIVPARAVLPANGGPE